MYTATSTCTNTSASTTECTLDFSNLLCDQIDATGCLLKGGYLPFATPHDVVQSWFLLVLIVMLLTGFFINLFSKRK